VEANPAICKLIIAGAVELVDKEPVFTKSFMTHVTHMLDTSPSKGESSDGWSDIISTFDKSLRDVSIWDLGIIMSLLAYHMANNDSVEAEKDDSEKIDNGPKYKRNGRDAKEEAKSPTSLQPKKRRTFLGNILRKTLS
jgi:hypothetical protein